MAGDYIINKLVVIQVCFSLIETLLLVAIYSTCFYKVIALHVLYCSFFQWEGVQLIV